MLFLKHLCLLAFLAGVFQLGAQEEIARYYFPDGTLSAEGFQLNGMPSGYWKNFYENGTLRSEGKLKAGKTDSIWKFYSVEGKLKSSVQYISGLKNGARETYDDAGKLISTEIFSGDKKEGISLQFFSNGIIQYRIPFHKDREEGRGFEFDTAGRIIRIYEYSNGVLTERKSVNRTDLAGKKTGIWIETDENLVIRKEIFYKGGLPDEYIKWYDEKGNLLKIERYQMGRKLVDLPLAELAKSYYQNKKLKSQGSFIGNTPTGLHLSFDTSGHNTGAIYYEGGEPFAKGKFDDKGLKTGIWKEFYPGGVLKAEGNYEQDIKTGAWKYYHLSGKIEQSGSYSQGKPTGTWRWYYENGNLLRETSYINGKEDGFSYELDESGDTLSRGEYVDDEREGPWYIKQGFISVNGFFIAGKPDGKWVHRYPSGEISFEGNFVQGAGAGKHKAFYENGKIRWEGGYLRGKRDGIWSSYAEDGTLIISVEYREGLEIKYDGVRIKPEFEPDEWENIIHHNPYIF